MARRGSGLWRRHITVLADAGQSVPPSPVMVKAVIARARLNGTGDVLTCHVPSGQLKNMPLSTMLKLAGWPSGPCTALGPAYRGPFVHLLDVPCP